jgi:hypothetical protein
MTRYAANDIATDADLINELGGVEKLASTMKTEAQRDAYRALAWQDCVNALAGRSPPIFESDLNDPTELKDALVYRALHKAFWQAMVTEKDRYHLTALRYQAEYNGAIARRFTVQDKRSGPSGGAFGWSRR